MHYLGRCFAVISMHIIHGYVSSVLEMLKSEDEDAFWRVMA